jgi:hypothetical protein
METQKSKHALKEERINSPVVELKTLNRIIIITIVVS